MRYFRRFETVGSVGFEPVGGVLIRAFQRLLIVLGLCVCMGGGLVSFSSKAMEGNAEEVRSVYDNADLLTEEEEQKLRTLIKEYSNAWDLNVLAVTTENADGKTTKEYADDFYDMHFPEDTQEDGVLYLIDMEHREIYISTSGIAIRYLTDQRIEHLLDAAYERVSEGDYYGTFVSFLENTGFYVQKGIPSDQYNYDVETGERDSYYPQYRITSTELLIALAAGFVSAAGAVLFVKAKYQLKFEDFHYDAYTDSEVQLSIKEDRLINTMVTHRRIPRNQENGRSGGGSGRSSVHHSSSGRSHGGGGRKF